MSNKEHRRTLAIKRADAEPLTREDLQYDFLKAIFDDKHAVFTDQTKRPSGDQTAEKLTFRDLYVNALINSPRSSKVLRDKMIDSQEFGTDFGKISLLTNVGRINTTMAFFPEMRTALRTYHPVPALQKTDGNLQDAPRIKNTLKACLLNDEAKGAPTTPSDVLLQRHAGKVPSTSVVNLIFVMANHSAAIGQSHLDGRYEFVDLFLPVDVSSKSRAKAFLWLCFHYLEPIAMLNPYDDDYSRDHHGKAPRLIPINAQDLALENIDPPEEKEWGLRMAAQRQHFLREEDRLRNSVFEGRSTPGSFDKDEHKGKGRELAMKPIKIKEHKSKVPDELSVAEPPIRGRGSKETLRHKTSHQRLLPDTSHQSAIGEPYPRLQAIQPAPVASAPRTKGGRTRKPPARHEISIPRHYEVVYSPPSPERTMLQHAWHVVSNTDPLLDSDEELADHHTRLDYIRRLQTLTRLRRKSPTPEPLPVQSSTTNPRNRW